MRMSLSYLLSAKADSIVLKVIFADLPLAAASLWDTELLLLRLKLVSGILHTLYAVECNRSREIIEILGSRRS